MFGRGNTVQLLLTALGSEDIHNGGEQKDMKKGELLSVVQKSRSKFKGAGKAGVGRATIIVNEISVTTKKPFRSGRWLIREVLTTQNLSPDSQHSHKSWV